MLICVLGLPGSGKSTLAQRLETRLRESAGSITGGAATVHYLHPGRYAYAMGWVPRYASRAQLAAVPHLTDAFLDLLAESLSTGEVVTDGFPRTVEQARLLAAKNFDVVIVNLVFPRGQEVELSIARQLKRIADDGVTVPTSEVEEQTSFALANDQPAANELIAGGLPTVSVDALLSESEVEEEVVKALCALVKQRAAALDQTSQPQTKGGADETSGNRD